MSKTYSTLIHPLEKIVHREKPTNVIIRLCSSTQLYEAFGHLAAHCLDFATHNLYVLVQSHCPHRPYNY